ncbi:unnamed protein product [Absidia cylindrospora]
MDGEGDPWRWWLFCAALCVLVSRSGRGAGFSPGPCVFRVFGLSLGHAASAEAYVTASGLAQCCRWCFWVVFPSCGGGKMLSAAVPRCWRFCGLWWPLLLLFAVVVMVPASRCHLSFLGAGAIYRFVWQPGPFKSINHLARAQANVLRLWGIGLSILPGNSQGKN